MHVYMWVCVACMRVYECVLYCAWERERGIQRINLQYNLLMEYIQHGIASDMGKHDKNCFTGKLYSLISYIIVSSSMSLYMSTQNKSTSRGQWRLAPGFTLYMILWQHYNSDSVHAHSSVQTAICYNIPCDQYCSFSSSPYIILGVHWDNMRHLEQI